jgi:hypothetical protein
LIKKSSQMPAIQMQSGNRQPPATASDFSKKCSRSTH